MAVAALIARRADRLVATIVQVAEVHGDDTRTASGHPAFVVPSPRDGAIQAIYVRGLVRWAGRHSCLLAMQAGVGDFVTAGQPMIAVFGLNDVPPNAAGRLQGMAALGIERTIEQDLAFGIRIMVDIAIKALSAAINDPTTAIQVMDHLENVMRRLGSTALHAQLTFSDTKGITRLLHPGRTWEDYLTLAVTEIREFGATDIQVTRRLRALLQNLEMTVRPENRAAVNAELARLDSTVQAAFGASVDHDRAHASDRQGICGPAEMRDSPDQ